MSSALWNNSPDERALSLCEMGTAWARSLCASHAHMLSMPGDNAQPYRSDTVRHRARTAYACGSHASTHPGKPVLTPPLRRSTVPASRHADTVRASRGPPHADIMRPPFPRPVACLPHGNSSRAGPAARQPQWPGWTKRAARRPARPCAPHAGR
jgi:hypothetical protein